MDLSIVHDGDRDLASLSTEELKAELAKTIELSVKALAHAARVWQLLEDRGEDLSALRSGLREWLPMIAAGKLAAEAVVQFAGHNALLRALAELPLSKQREYARGEPVVVVTFSPAGGFASEKVPVHRLTAPDISLVFNKGHVRSTDEQIPLLQDRARRRQKRRPQTVTISLSAIEYEALAAAAKSKRMQVATLIMHTLRERGLLRG